MLGEEVSEVGQFYFAGDHFPFLEGWVIGKVYFLDGVCKESSEEGVGFEFLAEFVLLHHVVVGFEEQPALGQGVLHQADLVLVQADVLQAGGLRVDVELRFLRVVSVLQEQLPFVVEGVLRFYEEGHIRRYHGDNVFYIEFLYNLF